MSNCKVLGCTAQNLAIATKRNAPDGPPKGRFSPYKSIVKKYTEQSEGLFHEGLISIMLRRDDPCYQ